MFRTHTKVAAATGLRLVVAYALVNQIAERLSLRLFAAAFFLTTLVVVMNTCPPRLIPARGWV
eukprot:3657711-Rhodomonas_salina.1